MTVDVPRYKIQIQVLIFLVKNFYLAMDIPGYKFQIQVFIFFKINIGLWRINVPGGGYVELLQEVVDDEDGDHDGDEQRVGVADDENGPFENKRKIKPIFQKSYKIFFT